MQDSLSDPQTSRGPSGVTDTTQHTGIYQRTQCSATYSVHGIIGADGISFKYTHKKRIKFSYT